MTGKQLCGIGIGKGPSGSRIVMVQLSSRSKRGMRRLCRLGGAGDTEAGVARGAVGGIPGAGMDVISIAIAGVTQIGPPTLHTAMLGRRGVSAARQGAETIRDPFPDISRHVEQPIAVGLKTVGRHGATPVPAGGRCIGEGAFEGVHPGSPRWLECVAPRKFLAREAATRGAFPFDLGWQA